jgi:CelD/BcsL family acetyltransferase involved in cellulose biosynthesis
MIETRLIGEIGELESLIGEWDRLWRRSPTATPFQSPAWLIAWRRLFAPGELRCAAAFAGGELVGLAPFYLERGQHGTRLTPLGVSLSDYLDVLVDPRAPEAAAALASQLARTEWEECRFEALAPEAVALRLPTPPGVKDAEDAQESCPVVPMAGAAASNAAPRARRRRTARTRHRRLTRFG